MMGIARALYTDSRITFEQGDLTQVDGPYDLGVSLMALHHASELTATLQHISEMVAPGGSAIFVDPAQPPLTRR